MASSLESLLQLIETPEGLDAVAQQMAEAGVAPPSPEDTARILGGQQQAQVPQLPQGAQGVAVAAPQIGELRSPIAVPTFTGLENT